MSRVYSNLCRVSTEPPSAPAQAATVEPNEQKMPQMLPDQLSHFNTLCPKPPDDFKDESASQASAERCAHDSHEASSGATVPRHRRCVPPSGAADVSVTTKSESQKVDGTLLEKGPDAKASKSKDEKDSVQAVSSALPLTKENCRANMEEQRKDRPSNVAQGDGSSGRPDQNQRRGLVDADMGGISSPTPTATYSKRANSRSLIERSKDDPNRLANLVSMFAGKTVSDERKHPVLLSFQRVQSAFAELRVRKTIEEAWLSRRPGSLKSKMNEGEAEKSKHVEDTCAILDAKVLIPWEQALEYKEATKRIVPAESRSHLDNFGGAVSGIEVDSLKEMVRSEMQKGIVLGCFLVLFLVCVSVARRVFRRQRARKIRNVDTSSCCTASTRSCETRSVSESLLSSTSIDEIREKKRNATKNWMPAATWDYKSVYYGQCDEFVHKNPPRGLRSGVNVHGNRWTDLRNGGYHYANHGTDGGFYIRNSDGSSYHFSPQRGGRFTPPP